MTDDLLAEIVRRAEAWCVENGLKGPFETSVQIRDWGFDFHVQGSKGSAHCTFQRDGSRSLYERSR